MFVMNFHVQLQAACILSLAVVNHATLEDRLHPVSELESRSEHYVLICGATACKLRIIIVTIMESVH